MRDIGKNIKLLRLQQKMTQDELAERLFVTRQTVSNYETGKSKPDVEMLVKIAEVLGADVQQLIYGPQPTETGCKKKQLSISAGLAAVFLSVYILICPVAETWRNAYVNSIFLTLTLICAGWAMGQLIGIAARWKLPDYPWVKYARIALVLILVIMLGLNTLVFGCIMINDWLYTHELRGEWVEHTITNMMTGKDHTTTSYKRLPILIPEWLQHFCWNYMTVFTYQNFWLFPVLGAALWLLGFPKQRKGNDIN